MLFSSNVYAQTSLPTIDKSGTITTGGTFQTITLPIGTRHSVDFQNLAVNISTDICYIYFGSGTPTTSNSTPLLAMQGYLRSSGAIPNDTIQVTCTTTSDKFKLWLQ